MRTTLLLLILVAGASLTAQTGYRVELDLTSIVDDKIPVTVYVPAVRDDTATYVFPVSVPGTYEKHLWWRLVENLEAFDAEGQPLPVRQAADSQYVIDDAQRLSKLTYLMNDSFDDVDDRASVFHPAGTSFQGDSLFALNHCGIVGYLQGYQSLEYRVHVKRRFDLYCATGLNVLERHHGHDVYTAPSYDDLVDGPVLYSVADTARFNVAGVEVLVAVSHGKDKKIANDYAEAIHEVCASIGKFLPSMPVDRYAFLIYLWDGDTVEVKNAGSRYGALEHSYSSFYFWRYASKPFGLNAVAAHEFLHILMPLNLHSKEIAEFDFRDPKWSGHLWLYEGVTEYFANQSLLRGKSTSESRYLQRMQQAVQFMQSLPETFSLYSFSKNVLDEENQGIFQQIYQYGLLNALCLDILIREETDGDKGLLEVVYELTDRFGQHRPFIDETLCAEIESITSDRVGEYCNTYIYSQTRIPLKEYLPKIGWKFLDSVETQRLSFGVEFDREASTDDKIVIGPGQPNLFGLEAGDILVAIDGNQISQSNRRTTMRVWRPVSVNEVTMTVLRNDVAIDLTAEPEHVLAWNYNSIIEDADASDDAIDFRSLVFFGNSE